ncbi:MAG: hypothetical protein U5N26_00955 [Candidatus Marinimicrobia bacterium]|nr:hypothetical protein [Candidatus Neomarinimicrobiota bacterium]
MKATIPVTSGAGLEEVPLGTGRKFCRSNSDKRTRSTVSAPKGSPANITTTVILI